MANKDVKSTNGGGLVPVTTLPEKGKVGTLYKTPDGSVYYWFHEETKKEVEVPDIKVGDALNLVPIIDSATFCDMMDNILKVEERPMIHLPNKNVNFTLAETIGEEGVVLQDITIECGYSAGTEDPANYRNFRFGNFGEGESYIYYPWTDLSYAPTGKTVEREMWNIENASIIVTQELIDKLVENEIAIEDIAPLFENVPTKIIIVTNTNEGYIKVGGVFVLDSKNISEDWIYNDTYYNAKTVINNALKGVSFVLKEEDSSEQSVRFSKMTSFTYGKDPEGFYGVSINFDGRTIVAVDDNFYSPATITGAELKEQMRLVQGEWGLDFRGDHLMSYIEESGQVSKEEAQKLMAPGTIISLFDGLITLDYILSTGEEGDHIDYELYFNSPTEPWGEQFGWFRGGHPCLENVYCNQSSTGVRSDWSNIEDSKEYSTDIIIKFADSTTKAIKTTKDYISTIFSPNIPN